MSSGTVSGVLFLAATVSFTLVMKVWGDDKRNRLARSKSQRSSSSIEQIEARVQMDEGGRGIAQIIPPRPVDGSSSSHMEAAAKAILACSHAVIMTGFPCLMQNDPPTETDGPLGTLCLARTLVALGKKVRIVTDECNEDVLLACAAASNVLAMGRDDEGMPLLQLESFPGMATFDERDYLRLEKVRKDADMVIAVERAGPASDGSYRTMTGKDMTAILAPLDSLLQPDDFQELDSHRRVASIGIGDGGNEVGMGAVYDAILQSTIPLAEDIACVVPTDHLLVSSVSNWGAYALSASVALLATESASSSLYGCSVARALDRCMPSATQEQNICHMAVAAGAGDGISGERKEWVDGMPLSTSLDVLQSVKNIAMCIY
eukprot:GSChrysophyteH2.ASY1.ANO1.971.1 assembled CDS